MRRSASAGPTALVPQALGARLGGRRLCRVLRWPRCVMKPSVAVTRSQLQERLERLRLVGHRGPRITEAADPIRHGRDGQLIGIDDGDLVPRKGRRYLGMGTRAGRPGPEHRLVGRVLVEVDEYPLASLLLPPVRRDEIGASTLELACERYSPSPDLG